MNRQRIQFDTNQARAGLYITQIPLASVVVDGFYKATNNWERAAYLGVGAFFLAADIVAERSFRNTERYNESVR